MATDPRFSRGEYLKRHTEALIKALGYARACEVSGRSKATLGRYASLSNDDSERYVPVNLVVELEMAAGVPFVTKALAELQGLPAFKNAVRAAVDRTNTDLSVVEKVRKFEFSDEAFTIENEEMTPSMKIRRHKIRDRYEDKINGMYKG